MRLAGGSSEREGRVEVYYDGAWGTVCDDWWDINDAAVVCRMLGFPGAEEAVGSATFGQGEGRIVLDDVECQGDENSLAECSHPQFLDNNCGHAEDAGVRCTGESKMMLQSSPHNGDSNKWESSPFYGDTSHGTDPLAC